MKEMEGPIFFFLSLEIFQIKTYFFETLFFYDAQLLMTSLKVTESQIKKYLELINE